MLESGSCGLVSVTVAVLTLSPVARSFATSVKVLVAPDASVPIVHFTVVAVCVQPADGVIDLNSALNGSVSVSTTPLAGEPIYRKHKGRWYPVRNQDGCVVRYGPEMPSPIIVRAEAGE